MAWNRAGTVTVTNGSAVVTGTGTNFSFPNAQPGQAFIGPNGLPLEILSVDSATQLTLATPYTGGTANGQPFGILPTASFANDLALAFSGFKNTYGAMLDSIGQGMFSDGSAAAPGVRFLADQDTGTRRLGENKMSFVAGGVDTLIVGIDGVQAPRPFVSDLALLSAGPRAFRIESTLNGSSDVQIQIVTPNRAWHIGQNVGGMGPGTLNFYDVTGGACRMMLDQVGNLLVGATSGSSHIIRKAGVGVGASLLEIDNGVYGSVIIGPGNEGAMPTAASVIRTTRVSTTGRSVSAAGTLNASGADYAEYMTKATGCRTIAAGDVCGVDRNGMLTDCWSDAVSFVVKSTDPSLVGGDTWAKTPQPQQEDGEADDDFVARMSAWKIIHEAERVVVDRIAFCGQVPCNVTGDFEVGDYIIPAQDGDGIKAIAVKDDDSLTDRQYRRRIGKVWTIRDGRAWIDVQHG